MGAPEQDIRITKTKKALSYALLRLLETQNFQKITVNDICKEALVSRSTFYVHFYDKYKLLQHCLEDFKKSMAERTSGLSLQERLKEGLRVVNEKPILFKNIFFDDPTQEVQSLFREHFSSLFLELFRMREKEGRPLTVPVDVAAAFYANGMAGIIVWWIEGNFSLSLEEVAACQYKLLSDILPQVDNSR